MRGLRSSRAWLLGSTVRTTLIATAAAAETGPREAVHNGSFERGVDPWFQEAFRSIGLSRLDGTPKRSHVLLERIHGQGRTPRGGRRVAPAGGWTPGG